MPVDRPSSRSRFATYRAEVRERHARKRDGAPPDPKSAHRKRARPFRALLAEFWRLVARRERRDVVVALALLTVSTLVGLAPLAAPKPILDTVLMRRPLPAAVSVWLPDWAEQPKNLLTLIGVALVVLAVVSTALGTWSRWLATRATKQLQVGTRRRAFEHALRLPLGRVYDLKAGGATSLLRDDAGGVGDLIFNLIYNPWRAIVQLVASLIVLLWVDWRMLVGALAILPVVWLTHRTWIARIRPLWRDIRTTRQGIDGHATESFGGMRVVRAFARTRAEASGYVADNAYMARQEIFSWWWQRGVDLAWSLIIPLSSAALLWYGGLQVLNGRLTPGDLVMFLSFLTALLGPIAALAGSAAGLQNNLAGLDRTLDLLAEPTEFAANPDARLVDPAAVRGDVALENVTFRYEGKDEPVLRDVSLRVPAGTTVALVGPSGAGKTTLCNLVARFYDPTDGRVTLDGTDVRAFEPNSYRALLGVVEQDTFLFDGTVEQNVAYGYKGDGRRAPHELVVEAAKLANADGFIRALPDGYATLVGERGVKLSGGQRQRLTIARAILADPKLLVLDEATSNLDTESERLIQASLARLVRGRTCFVIAHRLSTIRGADQIVVLDDGGIVEQGTHDELMRRSGRYRSMVDLQTRPVEEAPVELAAA